MRRMTVKEIRAQLECLPDDLPVEFTPISGAWLGTSHPMRFGSVSFYDTETGEGALPTEPGAHAVVYLFEDKR